MITATSTTTPVDLEAVKGRQQATWASGDYAVIGTTLQLVGESICEAVDVRAGWQVLDVAAGNGNASMAAARRGCDVIATDYVGALLEGAVRRADASGLRITTREADAEALPFDDDHVREVLAGTDVQITRKRFTFRYRSSLHMFETFRDYYGPTFKAWAALDEDGRASFRAALLAHFDAANRATDGSLAADSEYLEVVATKRA
jgi:SAM-dependent methyltransferase